MKKEQIIKFLTNEDVKCKQKELLNQGIKPYLIYGYRCIYSNKWYIGQTCKSTLRQRARDGAGYLYNKKKELVKTCKFANAIIKYGWQSFEPYIFYVCVEKEADQLEKDTIKLFNSVKNGYNTQTGGQKHHTHSEETKKLISEMKKGAKNYNYGRTTSQKQKEASRIVASTVLQDPEVIAKRNKKLPRGKDHYMYGKHWSPEMIKQFSDAHKGKKMGGENSMARPVYCITDNKIFSCAKEAGNYYNLTSGTGITACCRKRLKRIRGKEFCYYEERPNH